MSTTHVGVYPSARLDVSQLKAAGISVTVETDDRFPEGQIDIQTTVAVVIESTKDSTVIRPPCTDMVVANESGSVAIGGRVTGGIRTNTGAGVIHVQMGANLRPSAWPWSKKTPRVIITVYG